MAVSPQFCLRVYEGILKLRTRVTSYLYHFAVRLETSGCSLLVSCEAVSYDVD